MNPQAPHFAVPLRVFSIGVAILAMLGAVLAELGWIFDVAALKSVFPGLATMKANTALAFLFLGGSLFFMLTVRGNPALRRIHQVLAAMVVVLGVVTLAEYLFDWNAGIDNMLFDDKATPAGQFPGRPSFGTALNFVLLGSALLMTGIRSVRLAAPLLAVTAFLISLLALYGYASVIALEDRQGKNDRSPMARRARINLLLKLKRWQEALDESTSGIEKERFNDELLYMRGLAYEGLGKVDLALADFTAAIEMAPDGAVRALKARSRLYRKSGKAGLARKDDRSIEKLEQAPAEVPLFKQGP